MQRLNWRHYGQSVAWQEALATTQKSAPVEALRVRGCLCCFPCPAYAQLRQLAACGEFLLYPFWLAATPCPGFRGIIRVPEFRGNFALAGSCVIAWIAALPLLRLPPSSPEHNFKSGFPCKQTVF